MIFTYFAYIVNSCLIEAPAPGFNQQNYAFMAGNIAFVIADKLSVQKSSAVALFWRITPFHGAVKAAIARRAVRSLPGLI
ncbi:hypothetical protein [Pantoea brenneri]|uniref:hypothetical protein n=1 Tax=Pantoea brenneri TaxID=472694 RepID=UPI00289EE153|nr:hypothetical protein [Pantoea brenneri]